MKQWDYYGVCPCGVKAHAPFGKLFFVAVECCPKCGTDKNKWRIQKMRWVSNSVWFIPTTWCTGHWEIYGD